jgi:prevent-host-death family protein
MTQVKWRDFRENLADIIERVRAGERVQITRHGKVVAVVWPPSAELRTSFYKQAAEAKDSSVPMTG